MVQLTVRPEQIPLDNSLTGNKKCQQNFFETF